MKIDLGDEPEIDLGEPENGLDDSILSEDGVAMASVRRKVRVRV